MYTPLPQEELWRFAGSPVPAQTIEGSEAATAMSPTLETGWSSNDQDAFLAVHRSIGQFEGKAMLSTWIHRVLVNAALMKLRSGRRRREESIDPLLPRFLDDGHHADDPAAWRAAPSGQAALPPQAFPSKWSSFRKEASRPLFSSNVP